MTPENQFLISVLQARLVQEQAALATPNSQIATLQKQIDAIKAGQASHAANITTLGAKIAELQKS